MSYDVVIKGVEIINKKDNDLFNIGISGNKIAYIGTEDIVGTKIISGAKHIAIPGMVNAHTHAAMTLLRSYADDMRLMDWLENKIWPVEAHMHKDDIYWGTMLAVVEMIKSGTTTFADMYVAMDKVAEAVEETGIRASLSRGLIGVVADGENKLQENIQLFKDWHGKANGRIQIMLGPHAPYTCPPEYLKKVISAAQNLGSEIHMHLAETETEVHNCIKETGLTPIALMDKLGMFEAGTLAAHCVHVTTADMQIMAKKHVRVAHNPQSNLKLASGIAPVNEMLNQGIIVALGTDGASSNNNLDMLEEARLAAFIHKNQTGDPTVIPASTALEMATVNGAKALGLQDLGEIEIGQKADIVLYDMDKPYWYPRYDRTSLFIYAANSSDADTVIVDGKVIMEKGQFLNIDTEKVYFEANKCAMRLTK